MIFHTPSSVILTQFLQFRVFLLCVIVFFPFCGSCQCLATLPSCSCQCFISMCDFSIDEQINDDDDDKKQVTSSINLDHIRGQKCGICSRLMVKMVVLYYISADGATVKIYLVEIFRSLAFYFQLIEYPSIFNCSLIYYIIYSKEPTIVSGIFLVESLWLVC